MPSVAIYIKQAIKTYGNYVVHNRAVPNLEDGLKPVHRHLLWAMQLLKLGPKSNTLKCAKIVGDTLGDWHPHGDSAAYQALVNLSHLRYPLVEGQGNFGSDTDPPAAMRYTEARFTQIGKAMFDTIEVVAKEPNYLGNKDQPIVLEPRTPNLLMNGSEGIAVGIASNVPPHNLRELLSAIKYVLRKGKKATLETILKSIKGPDYKAGVLTSKEHEVENLYRTGHGTLRFRCNYHYEDEGDGVYSLVVTGYAPRFNVINFLQKSCQDLVDSGIITSAIDESSERVGTRIVIEYKDAVALYDRVLPLLNTTVTYSFYTIKRDGSKSVLKHTNLLEMLQDFLTARRGTETKVLKLQLKKTEHEVMRTEAIYAGAVNLKWLAGCIATHNGDLKSLEARIIKKLGVSKEQAGIIGATRLFSFRKADRNELKKKLKELGRTIGSIKKKLKGIDSVVLSQLNDLDRWADDRKMSVREKDPEGFDSADKWTYWDGREIRQIEDFDGKWLKSRRRITVNTLMKCTEMFSVVYEDGSVQQNWLSYCGYGPLDRPDGIVALIPDYYDALVLVDQKGNCGIIEHPQTIDGYKAFKNEGPIIQAFGITHEEDCLLTWTTGPENHLARYLREEWPKTKRRNSLGRKPVPRRQDCWLQPIPPDTVVLDPRFRSVNITKNPKRYTKNPLVFLHKYNNLCFLPNGIKKILDAIQIRNMYKRGNPPLSIHPLYETTESDEE